MVHSRRRISSWLLLGVAGSKNERDEPRAKQYWESSLDGINLNRSVPNSTYDGMYLRRFERNG